ncbi:MAG: flagellar biosynthetic protein FliR [Neomegalonema sp.]|nr:flagellar biosynthetic protein FliR [Neomegalonema sp.]
MDLTQIQVLDALQVYLDGAESAVLIAAAIFTRISVLMFMLPGFGERQIPAQVKLAAALAFAAICWPLVWPTVLKTSPSLAPSLGSAGIVILAEATVGLVLGLATRFLIFALQTAGMLIAQNLSLSQMFGGGLGQEPEPTIATILSIGAVALALSLGLHVKAAALIVYSYDRMPFGVFPIAGDAAQWATAKAASAFTIALSFSLPFMVASFIYNLALGFINRAMPQMMVAFVGMPAIILAGMMLLALTTPMALRYWNELYDAALAAPLAVE